MTPGRAQTNASIANAKLVIGFTALDYSGKYQKTTSGTQTTNHLKMN